VRMGACWWAELEAVQPVGSGRQLEPNSRAGGASNLTDMSAAVLSTHVLCAAGLSKSRSAVCERLWWSLTVEGSVCVC
jgi:hypothetical protein